MASDYTQFYSPAAPRPRGPAATALQPYNPPYNPTALQHCSLCTPAPLRPYNPTPSVLQYSQPLGPQPSAPGPRPRPVTLDPRPFTLKPRPSTLGLRP